MSDPNPATLILAEMDALLRTPFQPAAMDLLCERLMAEFVAGSAPPQWDRYPAARVLFLLWVITLPGRPPADPGKAVH